jgi:hypothetical protein
MDDGPGTGRRGLVYHSALYLRMRHHSVTRHGCLNATLPQMNPLVQVKAVSIWDHSVRPIVQSLSS